MLESEAVREIFTVRRLGWGTKVIAREPGQARNTVLAWLRTGAGRTCATSSRGPLLACGVVASLRTVNRAWKPLPRERLKADRATVRFKTLPGRQMQVTQGSEVLAERRSFS